MQCIQCKNVFSPNAGKYGPEYGQFLRSDVYIHIWIFS